MKFLQLFNIQNLHENVMKVFQRFPVSGALIIISAALMFFMLHGDFNNSLEEKLGKTTLTIIVTFFLSVATYLSAEASNFSNTKQKLLQVLPLGFGVLFYLSLERDFQNIENIILIFLSLTGIVSYLFFAPYLKNIFLTLVGKQDVRKIEGLGKLKQSVFYTYFYNISVVFLMSFILGGALFGLGSIGITAVDALFDLSIAGEKTYGNWAITSLTLLTPIFALSQIPNKDEFVGNSFKENMFFTFLIKFVAIPFIVIYFLILYAYTIKVLANFGDWPKGEVTWMVIGFSIFGYITYIFSYIFEKKNTLIKKFRILFPYVVIPQIFMLFYAIYLRLSQYDLTINRYFVVVFGLWLLVISLYYIISQKKKLLFIPAILTLFTIIISIGPWGVYSLPESRQLERLQNNLKDAGIIDVKEEMYEYVIAQEIVPLKEYSDISQELSKDIYSGIDYLCDFDNCSAIKDLFPKIYTELVKEDKVEWEENKQEDIKRMQEQTTFNEYNSKEDYAKRIEKRKEEVYNGPNKWTIVSKITEKIKVKNYFSNIGTVPRVFYFGIKSNVEDFYPITLDDYDYITTISETNSWEIKNHKKKGMHAIIDMKMKTISLKDGQKMLRQYLFEKFMKNL